MGCTLHQLLTLTKNEQILFKGLFLPSAMCDWKESLIGVWLVIYLFAVAYMCDVTGF